MPRSCCRWRWSSLWQLAGKDGSLAGGALPTPDRVWAAWKIWAFGTPTGMSLSPYVGTWVESVLFSAQRVAKGFALAIVVGVPLGILIGWSKLAQAMVDPTIQWLRPVPITAWLPISIAIFGIADFGAVFLITIGAFYPIVINTTQGARDVDKNWIRAALMMGAGSFDILRRIVLPAALPSIFTGLRIGLGIGWTAVIVSEMVAVKSGLGYVLWDAYYVGRMDIVIADMVSIGLVGFLSDWLIVRLEMLGAALAPPAELQRLSATMGTISFNAVSKIYGGPAGVRALDNVDFHDRRGRIRRAARPVRLRQVDAAQPARRLRAAERGRADASTASRSASPGPIAAWSSRRRRCCPGSASGRTSSSARRCRAAPRAEYEAKAREILQDRRASRTSTRRCRCSSRAACASASASPACW